MKKLAVLMMAGILVFTPTASTFASSTDVQTVTWGDSTENASEQSTEQAAEAQTSDSSSTTEKSKPYLALGADLSASQQATVLSLMGLSGTDISNYNVVYVTNAEEHQYLGSYISSSVIGTKSLSSVLVRPAESGHGINVTTANINYCTEGMYKNALLTAGVEDADIMVVGPTSISGTAALIGALKAYAEMTDTTVNTEALDTSLNELVTTGQLEEAAAAANSASKEDIEALIAFIKAEIAKRDLSDADSIKAAVKEAIKDYNSEHGTSISLDEDEIQQIADLMVKISDLGLDYNTLLDQAADLYEELGGNITGEDIANALEKNKVKVATAVVKSFFVSVGNAIAGFFKSIFG
ncbi:MAG: DUF1002 domain-containing protein [Lachnospiraceae bacterium]|nr:DUF1002 domain-containing protein [Lachnospiraceae bacterium]